MIKYRKTLCFILAIVALASFPVLVLGSETKLLSTGDPSDITNAVVSDTTNPNTLDKSTCMIELGSMSILGIVGSMIIKNKIKEELAKEE